MSNNENYKLEFHGGKAMSLILLLIFVIFCVAFFVVFKVFEMEALAMGGILAIIIGSVFSKNWTRYWEAVVSGMSSDMMNMLALILLGDSLGLNGGGFVVFAFITPLHSMGSIISVLYLGIFASVIAFFAMNYMLANLPAVNASVFSNLATVISILAGVVIAHESLYWYQIAGGALIISGVVGTNFFNNGKTDSKDGVKSAL